MKYDTPFAERFKTLRETIGVSQSDMAKRLGISQQSISFYENGERLPDYYVLNRICEETGCSIKYLFGHQDTISDKNERLHSELGLSEMSLQYIRTLPDSQKKILDSMLEKETFAALVSLLEYTYKRFEDVSDPIMRSAEWDHHTYMCTRVFEDVMDQLYDENIHKLSPEKIKEHDKRISEELKARKSEITWKRKEKLHPAQYWSSATDALSKFKIFRSIFEEIENEE